MLGTKSQFMVAENAVERVNNLEEKIETFKTKITQ